MSNMNSNNPINPISSYLSSSNFRLYNQDKSILDPLRQEALDKYYGLLNEQVVPDIIKGWESLPSGLEDLEGITLEDGSYTGLLRRLNPNPFKDGMTPLEELIYSYSNKNISLLRKTNPKQLYKVMDELIKDAKSTVGLIYSIDKNKTPEETIAEVLGKLQRLKDTKLYYLSGKMDAADIATYLSGQSVVSSSAQTNLDNAMFSYASSRLSKFKGTLGPGGMGLYLGGDKRKKLVDMDFLEEVNRPRILELLEKRYGGVETYQRANEVIMADKISGSLNFPGTNVKRKFMAKSILKNGQSIIDEDEFGNAKMFEYIEDGMGDFKETGRVFLKTYDRLGREVYANLESNSLVSNLDLNKSSIVLESESGERIIKKTSYIGKNEKVRVGGVNQDFSILQKQGEDFVRLIKTIELQLKTPQEKAQLMQRIQSNRTFNTLSWLKGFDENPFIHFDPTTGQMYVAHSGVNEVDNFVLTGYGRNALDYVQQSQNLLNDARRKVVYKIRNLQKIAKQSGMDDFLFNSIDENLAIELGIEKRNVRLSEISEAFSKYMLGLSANYDGEMKSVLGGKDVYTESKSAVKIIDQVTSAFYDRYRELRKDTRKLDDIRSNIYGEQLELSQDQDKAPVEEGNRDGNRLEVEYDEKQESTLRKIKSKEGISLKELNDYEKTQRHNIRQSFHDLHIIEFYFGKIKSPAEYLLKRREYFKVDAFNFLYGKVKSVGIVNNIIPGSNPISFVFSGSKLDNVLDRYSGLKRFSVEGLFAMFDSAYDYNTDMSYLESDDGFVEKNKAVLKSLRTMRYNINKVGQSIVNKEDARLFESTKKNLLLSLREVDIQNAESLVKYREIVKQKQIETNAKVEETKKNLSVIQEKLNKTVSSYEEVINKLKAFKTIKGNPEAEALEKEKDLLDLEIKRMSGEEFKLKNKLMKEKQEIVNLSNVNSFLDYAPKDSRAKEKVIESFIGKYIISPRYEDASKELSKDLDIIIEALESKDFNKKLNKLTNLNNLSGAQDLLNATTTESVENALIKLREEAAGLLDAPLGSIEEKRLQDLNQAIARGEDKKRILEKNTKIFEIFDSMKQDIDMLNSYDSGLEYFAKKAFIPMAKPIDKDKKVEVGVFAKTGKTKGLEVLDEDYQPDLLRNLHIMQEETDLQIEKSSGLRDQAKMTAASPRQNILASALRGMQEMSQEEVDLIEQKKNDLRKIIEDANKNNYAYRFDGSQVLEELIGIDNENNILVTRQRMISAGQIGVRLKYDTYEKIQRMLTEVIEPRYSGFEPDEIQELRKDTLKDLRNVKDLKLGRINLADNVYASLSEDELKFLRESQTILVKNSQQALKIMTKSKSLKAIGAAVYEKITNAATASQQPKSLFDNIGAELIKTIQRSASWSLYAFKEKYHGLSGWKEDYASELQTNILTALNDSIYGNKEILALNQTKDKYFNEEFEKRFLASYTKLFFENKEEGLLREDYIKSLITAVKKEVLNVYPEKFSGVMREEKLAASIFAVLNENSETGKMISQHYPSYQKAMKYEVILDALKGNEIVVSLDAENNISGAGDSIDDDDTRSLYDKVQSDSDVNKEQGRQDAFKAVRKEFGKYKKIMLAINSLNEGTMPSVIPKYVGKEIGNILDEKENIAVLRAAKGSKGIDSIGNAISQDIKKKGIENESRVKISKVAAMQVLYRSVQDKLETNVDSIDAFASFVNELEKEKGLETLREDLIKEVSDRGREIRFTGQNANQELYEFIQSHDLENIEVFDKETGKQLSIIKGNQGDIIAQEQASGNKALVVNQKVRRLSNKEYGSVREIYEDKIKKYLQEIYNTNNPDIRPDNNTIFSIGGRRLQYNEAKDTFDDITYRATNAINDRRVESVRFKTIKNKKTGQKFQQAIVRFEGATRNKIFNQMLDDSGKYVWGDLNVVSGDGFVSSPINQLKTGDIIRDSRVMPKSGKNPQAPEHFIKIELGELFRVKDKIYAYTGENETVDVEKEVGTGRKKEKRLYRVRKSAFRDVTADPYLYGEDGTKLRHISSVDIQARDRVAINSVPDTANVYKNPQGTVPLEISGQFFFDETDRIPGTARFISSSSINTMESLEDFMGGQKGFAFDLETTGTSESTDLVRRNLFMPVEMYGRTIEFDSQTGNILRDGPALHAFLDVGSQLDARTGKTVSELIQDYQTPKNVDFDIRKFIYKRLKQESFDSSGQIKSWDSLSSEQKAFVLADEEISFFRNIAKYSPELAGSERDAIMAMNTWSLEEQLVKNRQYFGGTNQQANLHLQTILSHAQKGIERIKNIETEISGAVLYSNKKDFIQAFDTAAKEKIIIGQNVGDADIAWIKQWTKRDLSISNPSDLKLIELMHVTTAVRPDMKYRSLKVARKEFLGKAQELGAHLANVDTEDTIDILQKQISMINDSQGKPILPERKFLSKDDFLLKIDSSGADYSQLGAYRLRQDIDVNDALTYNAKSKQYELQLESFDLFGVGQTEPRYETVKAESLKEMQYKISGNYIAATQDTIVPIMEAQVLDDVRRMVGEAKIKSYSMSKEMNVRYAESDLKETPYEDGAVLNYQRKLLELKQQGIKMQAPTLGVLTGTEAEKYYDMLLSSEKNTGLLNNDSMVYMLEEKSDRYKRAFNQATQFFESEDAKRIQGFQRKVENLRAAGVIKSDDVSRGLIERFNQRIKERAAQMEQPRVADKVQTIANVELGTLGEEFAGMKSREISVNALSKPYIHSSLWNIVQKMSNALPDTATMPVAESIQALKTQMTRVGINFNGIKKMPTDMLDMVEAVHQHYLKNGPALIDNPLFTYIKDENDTEMISIFEQVEKELLYDDIPEDLLTEKPAQPGYLQQVIGPESPLHNPKVYYPEAAISYQNVTNFRNFLEERNMYVPGMNLSINAGILNQEKLNEKIVQENMQTLTDQGINPFYRDERILQEPDIQAQIDASNKLMREEMVKVLTDIQEQMAKQSSIDLLAPDDRIFQHTGGDSIAEILGRIQNPNVVGEDRESAFRAIANIALDEQNPAYQDARKFLSFDAENPLDTVIVAGKHIGKRFKDILTGDKKSDLNILQGMAVAYGEQRDFLGDNIPSAEKNRLNEHMASLSDNILQSYRENKIDFGSGIEAIQKGLSQEEQNLLAEGLPARTDTDGISYKSFEEFHKGGGPNVQAEAELINAVGDLNKKSRQAMSDTLELIKDNPRTAMLGAGVLLGGMMLSQLTGISGTMKEDRPAHDDVSKGSTSQSVKESSAPYQGPPPKTSTYLTENQGYNVNVSARNPGFVSNTDIGNAFYRGMSGQQVPMNIHHQDDTSQINSEWLSQKFTELLNQNFVRG